MNKAIDDKSPPARAFDDAFYAYTEASRSADESADVLREKLSQGCYADHIAHSVQVVLERHRIDQKLFLVNVRGAGGASPETLLTDGGRHGADGSLLPQEDSRAFAAALTARNTAMEIMISNWLKLTDAEKSDRYYPTEVPTS